MVASTLGKSVKSVASTAPSPALVCLALSQLFPTPPSTAPPTRPTSPALLLLWPVRKCPITPFNRTVACGNGLMDRFEQCEIGGFGCNGNCVCFFNTLPSVPPQKDCIPTPLCGNGAVELTEQCEPSGLHCNSNCTCEFGFSPTFPTSINCIKHSAGCGNKIMEPGEQCETDGVNCASNCVCVPGTIATVPISPHCLPPETANVSLTVLCTNHTEASYSCVPGIESHYLACHNGFLSFEECLPGLICNSALLTAPRTIRYSPCLSASSTFECGNGLVEPGESCEVGGTNCTQDCKCVTGTAPTTPASRNCVSQLFTGQLCGNGVVEGTEQCESGGASCTAGCLCAEGFVSTSPKSIHCVKKAAADIIAACATQHQTANSCMENVTGQYLRCDGDVSKPEFFNCPPTSFCTVVGIFTAVVPCTVPVNQSVCGNGVVEPQEECDSGDNCEANCTCSAGFEPTSPISKHCLSTFFSDLGVQCGNATGNMCVRGVTTAFLTCSKPSTVAFSSCPEGTVCNIAMGSSGFPCAVLSSSRVLGLSFAGSVFGTALTRQAALKAAGSVCGNGLLELPEECDSGTGCSPLCECLQGFVTTRNLSCARLSPSVCGNAVLDAGEECEVGGQFCGLDCKCTQGAFPTYPLSRNCVPPGRGNLSLWCADRQSGVRCVPSISAQYLDCASDVFHACPPGSLCSGTNTCVQPDIITVFPAFPLPTAVATSICDAEPECQPNGNFCSPGCYCLPVTTPTTPRSANCVPVAPLSTCGNGQADVGEACDGGSFCAQCVCSVGSVPKVPPSTSCTLCRNGVLNSGEQCESGALCDTDCKCVGALPTSPVSTQCTRCGNTVLEGTEQCENIGRFFLKFGGTGCADCECKSGFAPSTPPTRDCVALARCGNAVADAGEQCDSGNGCLSDCTCGAGYTTIAPARTYCAELSACGDGVATIFEECDSGVGCFGCRCASGFMPYSPPRSACEPVGTCGDSVATGSEECDSGAGCNTLCKCITGFQPFSPARSACQVACGNAHIEAGEECDGGTGCLNCRCTSGFTPSSPIQLACQPPTMCGNGALNEGEECDGGFGCGSGCLCEPGFLATGSLLCMPIQCGNQRVDAGEECDSGEGCAPWCQCTGGYRVLAPPEAGCLQL
eukprot:TRINITY_DN1778_c0_g1_i8.p1 TRINITY_DN1778_c0_g1~~TRINITY_DN1778_c0_g1_i8.p1  ORF type:complete len:1136 (-),score=118.35 TRINITY_DN1778_c0_g1_i8:46-3453(-)